MQALLIAAVYFGSFLTIGTIGLISKMLAARWISQSGIGLSDPNAQPRTKRSKLLGKPEARPPAFSG